MPVQDASGNGLGFIANRRSTKVHVPGKAFAITPSDTTDLDIPTRRIYIGVSAPGDLKVRTVSGDDITYKNPPVGWMNIAAKRVFSTGTTVSELIGEI